MAAVPMEIFGQTQMALGVLALATSLCLPGVDALLTQAFARKEPVEIGRFLRVKFIGASVLAAICIAYAAYAYFLQGQPGDYALMMVFLALTLPLEAYSITRAVWLGQGHISLIAKRDLSAAFLALLVTALFVWQTPENILLLVVVPRLIEATTWQLPYRTLVRPLGAIAGKDALREQKSYAMHRSILMILPTIEIYLDRVIVGLLYGFTNLAVFAVAKFVMEQLRTFSISIYAILIPRLAKGEEADARRDFWRLAGPISGAIVACACVLCFSAILAIDYFLTDYAGSKRYIALYLFGALFSVPGALIQTFTQARRKIKVEYASRSSVALIGLAAMGVLIPLYGLDGVVYAFIVKAAAISVVNVATCWRYVDWRIDGATGKN
ncbi:lipopolysaccharide biosynthesis protein [Solimonas sp. K1W22B-7]|uniref:lipopolysaccharide biosynthesis protein n=1 Tax=Solimonas sp. K1W22B-7 TaxID=2303331 RepID=UPI0013C419B6|nr:hypothetical protein [Solimonas sp. K1W22B-7]